MIILRRFFFFIKRKILYDKVKDHDILVRNRYKRFFMNYLSLPSFFAVTLLSLSSIASLWGQGSSYNPFGIPQGGVVGPVMTPPLYNPGPGNLAPAFSYVQQPIISPSQPIARSGLSKEAKSVIGKWTLRADQYTSSPSKITDKVDQINKDRRILQEAERAGGLTPQDRESIAQIKLLLNLAEVRALINLVSTAEASFSGTFSKTVGYSNEGAQNRQSQLLSKDWYDDKRNRLQVLLKDLQVFLSRHPEYAQNPPDLLIGLSTTYRDGIEALNKYNQFCNCLESPNLKGCTTLAQTSSKKPSRSRNIPAWQQRDSGDDEDYSDTGDDGDNI